ncbi:hypothetical protein [Pectobacterium carotovorum]|uniref:hypothetical protein n=1 Tax=Pectobacterium carotovorum TaxID=554 RepID=UPI000AC2987C|nr:hypothetical protein [Pectobacterium carotovorum]
MKLKSLGVCPFCKKNVRPVVVEANYARRDKCQCPECKESVYVCRGFGCEDYTKGGELYDDEFCPKCAQSISSGTKSSVYKAYGSALTLVAAIALIAFKSK